MYKLMNLSFLLSQLLGHFVEKKVCDFVTADTSYISVLLHVNEALKREKHKSLHTFVSKYT